MAEGGGAERKISLFDEGINYDSKERKRYFTITATSTTAAAFSRHS